MNKLKNVLSKLSYTTACMLVLGCVSQVHGAAAMFEEGDPSAAIIAADDTGVLVGGYRAYILSHNTVDNSPANLTHEGEFDVGAGAFCRITTTATFAGGAAVNFTKNTEQLTLGVNSILELCGAGNFILTNWLTMPASGSATIRLGTAGNTTLTAAALTSANSIVESVRPGTTLTTSTAAMLSTRLRVLKALNLAVATGLDGDITGGGQLTLPASATIVNSTFTDFSGVIDASAGSCAFKYPMGKKGVLNAGGVRTYTITGAGTIATVALTADGSTFRVQNNLTIDTLIMPNGFDITTLAIAAGKTLTIQTLQRSGGDATTITMNASGGDNDGTGTLKIGSVVGGNVTVTATTGTYVPPKK